MSNFRWNDKLNLDHKRDMSAVATFTKLSKSLIRELRQAAEQGHFDSFLQHYGQSVVDYEWSGYILASLLLYLEEQQIDLMQSEHDDISKALSRILGATCVVFTDTHRQLYFNRLASDAFSESVLRDFYNEFNETNEPDSGHAMLDGILAIRQSLGAVDTNSVIVLCIA